jgi:membrane-bound hydrogenase subunit beta
MNDHEKLEKLRARLGEKILDITNPSPRRIFLAVAPADLNAAAEAVKKEIESQHVSTISGVDLGETFEVIYHFGDSNGNVNVRTRIPKADPRLPSICPTIPGAILYERELQDMFGIVVDGIPDPRPLLTPDDWPAGNFPLRKDWKFDRPEEKIPGGKK